MKYIAPTMKIEEAMAAEMLALSVNLEDKEVRGEDALTKEDAWGIWDSDSEE